MSKSFDHYRSMLKQELPTLASRYHIRSLSLFGSYVRGEERPDSDLDVLVAFSEPPSLFGLVELENHLTDLLGVKVDLVLGDSLKPRIGERIRRELVPV